ncbi:hypothetical protein B0T14DRAFT_262279 [Immersiella caudata]|uniref:Uncharacterized protein n=1 Tax=Immersiella caudata TaxID=314043 RepID=A0AA40BXG7_9PEZI|nr:hypothetical protein B0T14DRAFT_262279 [Immersiella caudata]
MLQVSVAVGLRVESQTLDLMPDGVNKPFALTTISSVIEIAALLGIYWKQFDRATDRYLAQGNGVLITGISVPHVGTVFTVAQYGELHLGENRVIPSDSAMKLSLGAVPTLFQEDPTTLKLGLTQDPRDVSILKLGNLKEIADTMILMDCNTTTANYFRQPDSKHGHIFPIPFEPVGMLCKPLYVRKTRLQMLPNPTPYRWDKHFFNLRKLISEHQKRLRQVIKYNANLNRFEAIASDLVEALMRHEVGEWERRTRKLPLVETMKAEMKRSMNAPTENGPQAAGAHEDLTTGSWQKFLSLGKLRNRKPFGTDEESHTQSSKSPTKTKDSGPGCTVSLLDSLHDVILECDRYLLKQERVLVRVVLSEHFQQVLKMLNNDDDDDDDDDDDYDANGPRVKRRAGRKCEDLSVASPEDSQGMLMDIYFRDVLHEVKRRAGSRVSKMTFYKLRPYAASRNEERFSHKFPKVPLDIMSDDEEEDDTQHHEPEDTRRHEPVAESIWCVLVFRMLCWLTLHDFDKGDLQVSQSELLGLQLPVYVS